MEEFTFKRLDDMSSREVYCLAKLRIDTFVTEQKITDPELDATDLTALHGYLLNDSQTEALAVCRLFKEDGRWMLGRVAVAQAARGQKLGSQMLKAAQSLLKQKGVARLYCHAQMQAKPFYDYLGYQAEGAIFTEAGVKHVLMYKEL